MNFFESTKTLDLASRLRFGRLCTGPIEPGVWAILEPAGVQNHAPQLCWINPDQLACVWMAGGQEGTSGMQVVLSVLKRGNSLWSSPVVVSQDLERSEQNPLLFLVERSGKSWLQLIHTAQQVRQPGEEIAEGSTFSKQWTASLRIQERSPKGRWRKAHDLIDGAAFCRNPPHRCADGSLLLPIYRSLETGGAFGHDHSQVLLLDPDGRPTGTVVDVPDSTGRVHGSIVLSGDGQSLLQFFRSRLADRIYRSIGSLDGLHWTSPQATVLPNNNSSIQACRLASGRLAMIFNRFSIGSEPADSSDWGEAIWPRTRWPLSVALSEDDGDSWPWIRDLDTGFGFSGTRNWMLNGQLVHPTLLEGVPDELHLAYSWAGSQPIRYLCIQEEEIIGLESY